MKSVLLLNLISYLSQGYTAAQLATEPVGKLLAEEPANGGIDIEYQLLEAAKAGDLGLVRKIVGLHPHIVNCRDLDGRHSTPLHFAAGQLDPCYSLLLTLASLALFQPVLWSRFFFSINRLRFRGKK